MVAMVQVSHTMPPRDLLRIHSAIINNPRATLSGLLITHAQYAQGLCFCVRLCMCMCVYVCHQKTRLFAVLLLDNCHK